MFLLTCTLYDGISTVLDIDIIYKKFTYHPWAHNKFNKIFKHHNIVLTTRKEIRCLSDKLEGLREDIWERQKEIWKLWLKNALEI
jgi:hypothetical protein